MPDFPPPVRQRKKRTLGLSAVPRPGAKRQLQKTLFILLKQPDKLGFGEARKEQNVASKKKEKKRHFHAAIKHQSCIFPGKASKARAVKYLQEERASL